MRRYENIYNRLMERAKNRVLSTDILIEVHHILPKSMGGSNHLDNLVSLTLKEHFIAHLLLTKVYPNEPKMIKAFLIMCRKNPSRNANTYKVLKENVNRLMKEQAIEYHSNPDNKKITSEHSKTCWKSEDYREKQKEARTNYITEEYRRERSIATKRLHENAEFSKKIYSSIEKHSKVKSKEWIEKITIINKERANTKESKELASKKYKGSNFDNRRRVLDKVTNMVYDSAMDAAKAKNLKYEVVKKWLYKGIPKHDLVWLDNEGENND